MFVKDRLAVVQKCKPRSVMVCYAWDGAWEEVDTGNCVQADNQAYQGRVWAKFRDAVAHSMWKFATSLAPGKLGKQSDCFKQQYGAVGPDVPYSLQGRIIGHGFGKGPLPGYETTNFAKEKIDEEEEYTNKYGGIPDYDNSWDTRSWNAEYAEADPEATRSSSMVFVALGVGLVLAVALSR